MSFVKENDRNPLLGTVFLALVTKLTPWSIGPHALILRWREFSLLPLVGGLGSSLRPNPLPKRFRSGVILVALGSVFLNVGQVRVLILIIKGFEVPVLEEGTLGTER
jgi:hypothetical protein